MRKRRTRLHEISRKDLITKSRQGSKERYQKRLNYQISNFRGVDLDKFFNKDYFVYETPIKNDEYVCTIAFPGVLTALREVVKSTNGNIDRVNYRLVLKALRIAFDATDDVKVRCTCADFKYRYAYWALRNKYLYGPPIPGTEKFPEKRNPDDNIGAVCKHLDLFLSNKRWLIKAASIVTSLIKAYPEKAATYLYDPDEIKDDETEDEVEIDVEETPEDEVTDGEIEIDDEEISAEDSEESDDER